MKKFQNALIILLLVCNLVTGAMLLYTRKQLKEKEDYISKDTIVELAIRYNVSTSFLRKLFPNDIVYLDDGKVTIESLNPALKLNDYDYGLLSKENGIVSYPNTYQGIDVSKFSGTIDWQKVKDSGVYFAMIRAGYRGYSEGALNKDAYFEENAQGCNDVGIKLGVYFFSQAISVEEAIEEASFVINLCKNYKVEFPICFDMEEISGTNARANSLSKEEVTKITLAFCNTVREAGYTPIIYANSHWIFSKLDLEAVENIDKWYAQYASEPYLPYQFSMWQYTSSATIPGISNNADRNIAFIDYSNTEK